MRATARIDSRGHGAGLNVQSAPPPAVAFTVLGSLVQTSFGADELRQVRWLRGLMNAVAAVADDRSRPIRHSRASPRCRFRERGSARARFERDRASAAAGTAPARTARACDRTGAL